MAVRLDNDQGQLKLNILGDRGTPCSDLPVTPADNFISFEHSSVPPRMPPPPPPGRVGDVKIVPSGFCNQAGTQMTLVNNRSCSITAVITQDESGSSQNITKVLGPHQQVMLGSTFCMQASQWSWNLLSVK
jgi:hypothetical protein